MASRRVRERLASDVALWQADGLVDAATAATLRERWTQPGLSVTMVGYLGIVGGAVIACGFLGLIGAMAGSQALASLLAALVAGGLFVVGVKLDGDPLGRHPHSARVILALATLCLATAVGVLIDSFEVEASTNLAVTGLLVLPGVFALAYATSNVFILTLGLLQFFHWVGSCTAMMGRSAYVIALHDPAIMALVAAAVAGASLWLGPSERAGRERFGDAYAGVGLAYMNLSLLVLTLRGTPQLPIFMVLLTAAGVGQILLGARLKSGLVTGFGVTSLAVHGFTRYFEAAWDRLDAGAFFLLGGGVLFAGAVVCERWLRDARRRTV